MGCSALTIGLSGQVTRYPVRVYVIIGIVAWELFLQIMRHLLSIDRKL